jgi:serine protease Do
VNLHGEVIGINAMIRGMSTGIGFAIPSNLARKVTDGLIKEGKFVRARIGVEIRALRENQDVQALYQDVEDGVVINGIMRDGPAAKSELRAGDVVLSVDGKPVRTSRELKEEIAYKKVGSTVQLEVVRLDRDSQKKLMIPVKTEAIAQEESVIASTTQKREPVAEEGSAHGLTVQAFTKSLAEKYSIDFVTGVLVTEIAPDTLADRQRIQPGDVITHIDDKAIKSVKQFRDAMSSGNLKRGIVVRFVTEGTDRMAILRERN